MDFTQILLNTQNPDARIRTEAENFLAQSKGQNLGMYLTTLTAELVDENKNLQTRMVAGIILKNELTSQNETKRLEKESSWLNLDHGIRDNIKNGVLHTLGSPVAFSRAAAVCACIAQIELPKNLWPQLIDILLQNTNSNNESLKKGTLQALGYICEELNPAVVADKSNGILTAIVQSMREEEKNVEVKHAAAKALENALEFAKENFTRPVERDYIMSMVCGAVCSPHLEVKVAGYECLVKIANLYYEFLPPYMQSLFNLTLESIKKDDQSAALQAIEFWSTICDEEIYLMDEIEEANSLRVQPSVVCHNFVKGALQFLVPLILETLTKQDEDADEDQWDIAMAGATCLTLISNCVRNEILQTVVPFVTQNLNNTQNWHLREAASMAFGSILEGVSDISPLIVQAIPILILHMQGDSQPLVKDTAAWTIGRICQLHPSAIHGDVLNSIMTPLLKSLGDTPRVAANVCWALNNIAESFRDEESKPADNFRPYFESSVSGLLQAAERSDADENNLKASAYEAINEFMQSAEGECLNVIQALVPIFVARLEATFNVQILSQEDRDNVAETQGLLCSLLQTCTQKLDKQIAPFADACAALYLRVFNTKSTTVQEEALMAFGALANALEGDFEKYMAHFLPFLLLGLNSHEAYQVCTISVGVVGDVCRALQKRVAQYCQDIITILINHLKDTHLNKSVKPPILSCFGDMALAICGEFTKYLNMVMLILLQAASYEVDKTNDELVDFQNELREGIFEAFTGILQGLRTDDQAEQFLPYVDNVVAFITTVIFKDQTRTDNVTRGAIGVLGDLAHALGSKVKPQLQQDAVRTLISQCLRSDSDTTVEVATWAQEVIAKL